MSPLTSTLAALAGIVLAALLYLGSPRTRRGASRVMAALGLYGLSRGKFYFDPIYRALGRLAAAKAWPRLAPGSIAT